MLFSLFNNLHKSVDSSRYLTFRKASFIHHIGFDHQAGDSSFLFHNPLNVQLAKGIRLATAVGMQDKAINIVFINHGNHHFSHFINSDIQINAGVGLGHGIDKITFVNVFHRAAPGGGISIGYQAGIATELGNIGLILADKGLHKQAVLTLAESMAIMLATGVANGLKQALLGLARCDDQLGRDQVRELLEQARLAAGTIADLLERSDQLLRKRPQPGARRRAPLALRRLATGSPS